MTENEDRQLIILLKLQDIMQAPPTTEQQVQQALQWIDNIPLSRTPKNLSRDFSDGVLIAEAMHYYYPNFVHLHNYQAANSSVSKYINWKTLNEKVFRKLNFQIHKNDIEGVITVSAGAIQRVLYKIYSKVVNEQQQRINSLQRIEQNQLSKNSTGFLGQNYASVRNKIKDSLSTHQITKQLSSQLADRQMVIKQLQQTIQILQTKFKKMEQLNKLKDAKIDSLMKKLDEEIGI